MPVNKTEKARPVERLSFNGRVDIIVPFHGKYEIVSRAIESIFRYTFSSVYHVILVDDCSPNAEFIESLAKVPNVTTMRNPTQLGFGGALRRGFERSQELDERRKKNLIPDHPYVVAFQSDCRAEDVNWLKGMGETLLAHREGGVKMVCPRTNNPGNGDPAQKGERGAEAKDVILTDPMSLYCFLCHRDLFLHVGGFLKDYPYGWYEDEEFAHRMNKNGFKQAASGRSYIYHEGEATIRSLWRTKPESRKVMEEENRKRCVQDMRS